MNDIDGLIATFCHLVQIDSPTGHEQEVSDCIKEELAAIGVEAFQDERANLIINLPGTGEPFLLAAHLDTVEPGRGIRPVVEDGIIKSSGDTILAADDKAAVAMLVELIRWVQKEKPNVRPLDIVFSVSEEAGESGIDTLDIDRIRAREGLTIDAAQPVGSVILASPYYLRQEMKITGLPADASTADQGRSAIPAATAFLNSIPHGKPDSETFCNVGILRGGYALNAVLSEIELRAEIRSFTMEGIDAYAVDMKAKLQKAGAEHGCEVTYFDILENEGYALSTDEPLIKRIAEAFAVAAPDCEFNPIPRYWGISDANNLNRAGIRTANVGYGAKEPHTVRERIAIADLSRMFYFLQALVAA